MSLFEKGKAAGTEKESNIIIRLLDNVPGTAVMGKNIFIIVIFYRRYPAMVHLTNTLCRLLRTFDYSPRPLLHLLRTASRSLHLSLAIVMTYFVMMLMYYFNANFSDIYTKWNFSPFPLTLIGWQTTLCLILLSLPPFLATQVIMGSVISLAAGGLCLFRQLNKALAELNQDRAVVSRHSGVMLNGHTIDGDVSYENRRDPHYDQLCALRITHFRIAQYIHHITEVFSELLLVNIAADFAAAVGFVGLLIGRPSSSVRRKNRWVMVNVQYQDFA